MSGDARQLAKELSEARMGALALISDQWSAGPNLPSMVLDHLFALREACLVERKFMDEGPPITSLGEHEMHVRLSACWHFRLTPLGCAVLAEVKP